MRVAKFAVLLVFLAFGVESFAQVRQIDPTKLPQDASVLAAYTDLLTIDEYGRNYEAKWRYPIARQLVVKRFSQDLSVLEAARKKAPDNGELHLLTGLVGHLAYNLDVDSAYTPALNLLQSAESAAGKDFRPAWFLAMHRCESNDPVAGMNLLLRDEHAHAELPAAFWRDYMICAGVSFMPAHALRAYDRLVARGGATSEDTWIAGAERKRFIPSSVTTEYPKKQAWQAETVGDSVRFTSSMCGESFLAKPTSPIDVSDVKEGTCAVQIIPGQYPTRHGKSTPTLLVLTQRAKPGETLETHMRGMLADPRYSSAKPMEGVPCPVVQCVAYEIVTDKMYEQEGGAHLIALGFASEQPAYPGLLLETPHPLPKPDGKSAGPQFLRPDVIQNRFDGTLFTFVALDANADIYAPSRHDFDALVKSMAIDAR